MSALLLLYLLFPPPAPVDTPSPGVSPADAALQQGRTYTQWFYDGDVDRLWPRLSPELQQVFESPAGVEAFRQKVRADAGREVATEAESVIPWLGSTIYTRTARFSRAGAPVAVQWTIDDSGAVRAFTVRPAASPAPSRYLDYRTKTRLRLPFQGRWFVFWGGRTIAENYHAASPDQRFAYDLLVVSDESTHGPGADRNEDYYCFGAPVLAPAGGTVVRVVGDVPDNVPGTMNEELPLGNHVVLDHGAGEFSFLAHLMQGSPTVHQGDEVAAGTVLGRCGNSGRSSEPHLHYHLQKTSTFGQGAGLPAQFVDYCAEGAPIARGEPRRGQTIAPAGADGCGVSGGIHERSR